MTGQFMVRLSADLDDRLKVAALVTDQTSAAIVRAALEAHLLELEKSAAYKKRRAELIIATTPVTTVKPRRNPPVPKDPYT